jgi:hypothetical protein
VEKEMTTSAIPAKDLNVLIEGVLYQVSGRRLNDCVSDEVQYKFCMYVGLEYMGPFIVPWRVFGWATSSDLFRVRVPEEGCEVLGNGEFVKSSQGVYACSINPGKINVPIVQAFLEKWKELAQKRFSDDERIRSYHTEVVKTLGELDNVDAEIEKLKRRQEDLRRLRNDYDRGFRIETSIGLMKRGLDGMK